jgi:hypothetical protein
LLDGEAADGLPARAAVASLEEEAIARQGQGRTPTDVNGERVDKIRWGGVQNAQVATVTVAD